MSLGEALGGISGEKFRGEKNDEKKEVKAVASDLPRRDTRTPVRRDFREESLGMGPARLRSSFGWAGGLFALRVPPCIASHLLDAPSRCIPGNPTLVP